MTWWNGLVNFFRRLVRGPQAPPARVEDSPETEMETERKRGMRGM